MDNLSDSIKFIGELLSILNGIHFVRNNLLTIQIEVIDVFYCIEIDEFEIADRRDNELP